MSAESGTLMHYGTPMRSGRYPWGSGEQPFQHQGSEFLRSVDSYKSKGMTEKDIAKAMGLSTTQYRSKLAWANEAQKNAIAKSIQSMKKDGKSNREISKRLGISEGTVRNYQKTPKQKVVVKQISTTADELKKGVEKTGYLDVGTGVERQLGISRTKLRAAVEELKNQGYYEHEIYVKRLTDPSKYTIVKVLSKDKDLDSVKRNQDKIRSMDSYSDDGGLTFSNHLHKPIQYPANRVAVKYGDKGGVDRDGLIEIRRGVKDLDLGASKYAQVRIALDDGTYVKGMAMYSDDLPKGVDIRFNTNKPSGTPRSKVFKTQKTLDPSNPFESTITRQSGALNIVNEQGYWDKWGTVFPSQFLSKQPVPLIKDRLKATYKSLEDEYNDISKITNPTVRKYLLTDPVNGFVKTLESKQVSLKAQGLPRTKNHVLIPYPDMKPNEIYAPNYRDGEQVVLVRYPHGGTFELPSLTVNNKYSTAKKQLGNATDAVGIHPSVAQKLSGADFDGDTVWVIPNNSGKIHTRSSLPGLKDFDPNSYYVGHKTISPRQKQTQMGIVSNLITDMTIHGASTDELTRAVRHSMVVIDSEKHQLDWRQSAKDNAISALQKKYQTHIGPDGKMHKGASTIVSRSKSDKVEIKGHDETYVDKSTGKTVVKHVVDRAVPRIVTVDDAYSMSSGSAVESAYADYVNKLKALSNRAQKQAQGIQEITRNPQAVKMYPDEIKSLRSKLNTALLNAPKERQAQILASNEFYKRNNKDLSADQRKKIKAQALVAARSAVGAKKQTINITDKEWEAIQNGAISKTMLASILNNTDMDSVRKLATPKDSRTLRPAQLSRAKTLLSRGYTQADVASSLGVSVSTLRYAMEESR